MCSRSSEGDVEFAMELWCFTVDVKAIKLPDKGHNLVIKWKQMTFFRVQASFAPE